MKANLRYEVLEDNGGGLHLFVWAFKDEPESVEHMIYAHSGFEHLPGQLQTTLADLHNNGDPTDWDGCEEDMEYSYNVFINHDYSHEIIAAGSGTQPGEIYVDLMGLSGLREFNQD